MTIDCPQCGEPFVTSQAPAGQTMYCTHCGQAIMLPVTVGCPNCHRVIEVPVEQVGQIIRCPKVGCGRAILVPPPGQAAAAPAPSPTRPGARVTAGAVAVERGAPPRVQRDATAQPPGLPVAPAKPWRLRDAAAAVILLPCFWPFFAGLAFPVVVFAVGHLPGFHEFYDTVVLNLVYRLLLPLLWVVLGCAGLLSFYRQDSAGPWRVVLLFVVGMLLGTLAVFDCWYFAPFAMATVVGLALWRIRWLWWARCRGVAGLTVLLVVLVLAGMALDWNGLWPVFDNRFGPGLPKVANLVFLAGFAVGLAVLLFVWSARYSRMVRRFADEQEADEEGCALYEARGDLRNRSLLEDLIARDPRCVEYFDIVRRLTRCRHPAAVVPRTGATRLVPCSVLPPPRVARSVTQTILPMLRSLWVALVARLHWANIKSALSSGVWKPAMGLLRPRALLAAIRAWWDQLWIARLLPVPQVVHNGWELATNALQWPWLVRVVRLCRKPAGTLAFPSDVIRAMLTGVAQREYRRYWDAIQRYWDGPQNRPEADRQADWQTVNQHFARLVLLYEASLEAQHYFFLAPALPPAVAEADVRVKQLKTQIKELLDVGVGKMSAQPAAPAPQTGKAQKAAATEKIRAAQREAWQGAYTKYLDLWLENVDRMMIGYGLDMFAKQEELQDPVSFAQLTCNVLASRAELRRLDGTATPSIHAMAADLALWLLIQQTSPERLRAGPDNEQFHEAQALFTQYFASRREKSAHPRERAGKGRDKERAAVLQEADAPEYAIISCAYALWQGTCGNWDAAFRPVFLFGQMVFGACAKAQAAGPSQSLVACSSSHAMLRMAVHVKAVQALRALLPQPDETAAEPEPVEIGEDLDFGKQIALESAVALFLNPNTACSRCNAQAPGEHCADGDFLEWHKQKGDAVVACVGNHALALLRRNDRPSSRTAAEVGQGLSL